MLENLLANMRLDLSVDFFDALKRYLPMSFTVNALTVAPLVALCAALLGVTLVLKRYSMIGDGLSHVTFGTMTVATTLSLSPMYVSLPVTTLVAIWLLRGGRQKLKGDSAIAILSVSFLSLGYVVMNIFPPKGGNVSGDVCSILFGSTSIITLSHSDVILCVALAVIVILFYLLFYKKIFAVTFDEDFARATGTNASAYNLMLAIITAVVIVLAVRLVGALLITALIVFPAQCGMRLFKSFRGVILSAAAISVCCAVAGILVAIVYSTPVGCTIVGTELAAFLICVLIDTLKGGRKK